jgi:hypothetical protein
MKPTNPLTYVDGLLAAQVTAYLAETDWAGKVAVHTGENDGERTVPCVVTYAAMASTPADVPDFLRNYEVQCTVMVESKADPQPDAPEEVAGLAMHRDIVQDVMDCLRDVEAFKTAAAADGHKVYEVQPQANQPELLEDSRSFQTSISFLIVMVFDLQPAG